jgi:predicted secreted protein
LLHFQIEQNIQLVGLVVEQGYFEREVVAGQNFMVDLEAMPGAGYMWTVSAPDNLELIGENIISRSKEIGGNSYQRFILVAHKVGIYTLTFTLKRKWEIKSIKNEVFTINVSS